MARLTSICGVLALALASLGLYGVTAYGVSQRTREIGVRMALGADRRRIIRTCVRRPLAQTCAGLAIGMLASILVGRTLNAQLYGVGGLDPTVFGTAILGAERDRRGGAAGAPRRVGQSRGGASRRMKIHQPMRRVAAIFHTCLRKRSNRFVVMRWTRGSGPGGVLPWDVGRM
jgi:hypothetical protein